MQLQQINITGARVIGALNKDLGFNGPKHHAVVLGLNPFDGHVYVAELMAEGHQVARYADFERRYASNGPIQIAPNTGQFSNAQVAQRAIAELRQGQGIYDLVVNNCESFVNRAMHNTSKSTQVSNTVIGAVFALGLIYVLRGAT